MQPARALPAPLPCCDAHPQRAQHAAGARTSFKMVAGVTYGTALSRDRSSLPQEMQGAKLCEKWAYRCEAAARTWMRPHAQDNLM